MIQHKAEEYACNCHEYTHHLYGDNEPYRVHLRMVVDTAKKFIRLVTEEEQDNVLAACWCHDLIEDCRQTYNDVKKETNHTVAELVYALTNEKGRNRAQRGNEKYYEGIRNTPNATFIKLCDRIANYQYSKENGSSMMLMYEKENEAFMKKLYDEKYVDMFDYLSNLMLEEINERNDM